MKKLLIPFVLLALGFIACTERGVIGESVLPDQVDVSLDTFFVQNTHDVETQTYSSKRPFMSAGVYNDPVYGQIEAEAYYLPYLVSTLDADSMSDESIFYFNFKIADSFLWGDTTSTSKTFGLYQITESWNNRNVDFSTSVSTESTPFVTFDYSRGTAVGQQTDSISVVMPDEWVDMYRGYLALEDSNSTIYGNEYFGFAIKAVDQNPDNGLILPISLSDSYISVRKTAEDTVLYNSSAGGYLTSTYVNRTPTDLVIEDDMTLISSVEGTGFGLNFFKDIDELGQYNVSNGSFVINEVDEYLEAYPLPAYHTRPEAPWFDVYLKRPEELDLGLEIEYPTFGVLKDSVGYTYSGNLLSINSWKNSEALDTLVNWYIFPTTGYLSNVYGSKQFEGIIFYNLIYNGNAEKALTPKVVVTRVEPNGDI